MSYKRYYFVALLCSIILLMSIMCGRVSASTVTTSTVPLSVPIHFDDTWWTWPSSAAGYTSYAINITPEADGSPDGYFFSSFFTFVKGGAPYTGQGDGYGYLGLQTEEAGGFTGKNTIFSIWGSTAASGGQYKTTFTEGSSGWSVRNSYQWVVGHSYRLTVTYLSTNSSGEVWQASVTDNTTKLTSTIGQLTVPTSFGMLAGVTNSFHERYSGLTASCSDMHFSEVEFTNPLLNGSIGPTGHTNDQPNVTPCVNYGVEDINGGLESAIGGLPPQLSPTTSIRASTPATTTAPPVSTSTPAPISTPQASSTITATPIPTSKAPPVTYSFELQLVDKADKPIPNAQVILNTTLKATTNSEGKAVFKTNLASGKYPIMVNSAGYKPYQTVITIPEQNSVTAARTVKLQLDAIRKNSLNYELVTAIILGSVAAIVVLYLFRHRVITRRKTRNNQIKHGSHPEISTQTSQITRQDWQVGLSTLTQKNPPSDNEPPSTLAVTDSLPPVLTQSNEQSGLSTNTTAMLPASTNLEPSTGNNGGLPIDKASPEDSSLNNMDFQP